MLLHEPRRVLKLENSPNIITLNNYKIISYIIINLKVENSAKWRALVGTGVVLYVGIDN